MDYFITQYYNFIKVIAISVTLSLQLGNYYFFYLNFLLIINNITIITFEKERIMVNN